MSKTAVGLLLALLTAGSLLAREPGFAEFRAVQESLSLQTVHPKVGGIAENA
jgi:hypothetical protein